MKNLTNEDENYMGSSKCTKEQYNAAIKYLDENIKKTKFRR